MVKFSKATADYVVLFADIEWVVGQLFGLMSAEQYNSSKAVVQRLLKGSTDSYAMMEAFKAIVNWPALPEGELSVAWGELAKYGRERIDRTRTRMLPEVRKRFVRTALTVMMIMVAVRSEAMGRHPQTTP